MNEQQDQIRAIQYQINSAITACHARIENNQGSHQAFHILYDEVDFILKGGRLYEVQAEEEVLNIIDIEASQLNDSLISLLSGREAYSDNHEGEHMYNIIELVEDEEFAASLSILELGLLKAIQYRCDRAEAPYFRIINTKS